MVLPWHEQGIGGSPPVTQGAVWSNFRVLGQGKGIFHVDPEIAHRILDLAMARKDLDGPALRPSQETGPGIRQTLELNSAARLLLHQKSARANAAFASQPPETLAEIL